jgi:hypothetical protein
MAFTDTCVLFRLCAVSPAHASSTVVMEDGALPSSPLSTAGVRLARRLTQLLDDSHADLFHRARSRPTPLTRTILRLRHSPLFQSLHLFSRDRGERGRGYVPKPHLLTTFSTLSGPDPPLLLIPISCRHRRDGPSPKRGRAEAEMAMCRFRGRGVRSAACVRADVHIIAHMDARAERPAGTTRVDCFRLRDTYESEGGMFMCVTQLLSEDNVSD